MDGIGFLLKLLFWQKVVDKWNERIVELVVVDGKLESCVDKREFLSKVIGFGLEVIRE